MQYDHVECPLFENGSLAKHSKHEILTPLEKNLVSSDYRFNKDHVDGLAVIVDFMSLIRKVGFEKHLKIKDALKRAWNSIVAESSANRIEIVYDSYLEISIKESLRVIRATQEPIEIVNLNLESPIPPEMEKFWASSTNKGNLQILSRSYFIKEAKEAHKNIVLSGYITDNDGSLDGVEFKDGVINQRKDLNCKEEEADTRLILHVDKAAKENFKKFLILSNDMDVVMYLTAYFEKFKTKNI